MVGDICLCMIVKDEAASIRETLDSVRDLISSYCIVDTGSTDGTIGEIVRWSNEAEIQGKIYNEEFRDYSQARNLCLDHAESHHTTFTLMLSGDETVLNEHPKVVEHQLREFMGQQDGAYDVPVKWGDVTLMSPRLARVSAKWRYQGVTHEVLVSQGGIVPTRSLCIQIDHACSDPSRKKKQMERDVDLLRKQVELDPKDARSWFYLGQSLQCLGRLNEAAQAYWHRVVLGGWQEEAFEAQLRDGQCSNENDWIEGEAEEKFLRAWEMRPTRAEPLYEIAEHAHRTADWPKMYVYALAASRIPYPTDDRLFVRHEVYQWRVHDLLAIACWNLELFEEGHRAAAIAFTNALICGAKEHTPRLADNLKHFERKLGLCQRQESSSESSSSCSSVASGTSVV